MNRNIQRSAFIWNNIIHYTIQKLGVSIIFYLYFWGGGGGGEGMIEINTFI